MNPKRQEPRLPCNPTRISARVEGYDKPVAGQIVEVSRTGVQLHVDEEIPVGSLMTVEVGGTTLLGDVRHCEIRTADQHYTVGMRTNDVQHATDKAD